mmetsp:Transcript_465/g.1306  ORF Transcript_465/g.1306 Transcript_465/m.1306 type:complete len:285 (+) Transcript_465:880-1734(+)
MDPSRRRHRPPITPNYNASIESQQQKHWLIRELRPISAETAETVDLYYRKRLESLKSVDQHVEGIMQQLIDKGQQDRTVFLYTSDNGYQFGQHRLSLDKRHLYEQDLRVPFCIRGPGVLKNFQASKMAANIDIAPTFLDIMGVDQSIIQSMDGLSFWDYVRGLNGATDPFAKRKDMLIAYNGEGAQTSCGLSKCPFPWDEPLRNPDAGNNTYRCVRTYDNVDQGGEDSIYCKFQDDEDFVEYYDINANPWQLNNDVGTLTAAEKLSYEARLEELLNCQGASCHP